MIKQDMIQRAVEQLAAVMGRIVGLISTERYEEALGEIREAKRSFPIVSGLIDTAPAPHLLRLLSADRCESLVALWHAEADALDGLGRTARATAAREKAQRLKTQIEHSAKRGR